MLIFPNLKVFALKIHVSQCHIDEHEAFNCCNMSHGLFERFVFTVSI